jgi:hypothetical protein
MVLLYMSTNESKVKLERERKVFLGTLAQTVPNDELSERVFRKFELATEYGGGLRMDQIKDHLSLALLD